MSAPEKRHEFRQHSGIRYTPVSCVLVAEKERIELEVVNFHFRGACLKIARDDYRFQGGDVYLYFKIGKKELTEKIVFRLVWETVAENGLFGVEFTTESSFVLSRAERFSSHQVNAPVITAKDPLDPNRVIYFKAVNASSTGMLLSTSMSNKHIFPGMELREASLNIPNIGKTEVDLFVENSRTGEDNTILYGVSVKGSSKNYNTLISKYLSNLGSAKDNGNRLELLAEAKLLQRDLRAHLTIREVRDQKSYEEVLKLRFHGYNLAGKIDKTKTWADMGDGLEEEGIILGAYLGGQLVASVEFRLNRLKPVRLTKQFNLMQIPGIRSENVAEVNKLVVHPKAQNSDIVLGIFQKIHALAMMNGRPDGLCAAEPKLVALYERLGFKRTPVTYPHPVKSGVTLTLMVIHSEAYATSEGMNPYAWSMAFSESQKFFESIGINDDMKLSLKQQAMKAATGVVLKFVKPKKKKKKADDVFEENLVVNHQLQTIDPRWTKQHLNATVLLPYVLEAELLIGTEQTRKILLDFGMSASYFTSVSNWISIDFFDEFIERFAAFGDPYILNRKAGYRSVTKEILGANYFVVKHFTPRMAFKAIERYLPKFNKTRTYKVIDAGPTHARIRLTNPDKSLLPKHPSTKENWHATAEAYVLALTGRNGTITPVKSAFDGDEYCEFVVNWTNPMFRPLTFAIFAASLAGFSYALDALYRYAGQELFLRGLMFAGAGAIVAYLAHVARTYHVKYHEMLESMETFEKEADERYRELQNSKGILEKSYQEGKILEALNKEIQVSENLDQILGGALHFLDEKFEFKRSFAMIKDVEGKFLRTSAVHGSQGPIQELWNFSVDVGAKRDNPLVLSSVFHSGQSILISNVSEHKHQLNEASRRLLELLRTEGFAIVPIPSGEGNWGVLVADKSESKEIITRRDLVALQRVAQAIGLALDKKAKIEHEVHIRKVFEKYVPSAVVSGIQGASAPRLGGQKIEVVCLFLDIRNFTNLSQQLPPEILCELLNQIFDIVQKNVAASGGIIDKFLGDGALVTWGAVPGSHADPAAAIATARAILQDLDSMNRKFVHEKGLKPVEIGIGIHKGPAIAGNIGSTDRMEFTVIGNTVNIASRLEQLTKVYKCHVIISGDLAASASLGSEWQSFPEVQVRGVADKINVFGMLFEPNKSEGKQTA